MRDTKQMMSIMEDEKAAAARTVNINSLWDIVSFINLVMLAIFS